MAQHVDVISVPYNFGQPKPGVVNGPQKMREAGIIDDIERSGLIVHDRGDLSFDDFRDDPVASNVKRPRAVGNANRRIADAVADSLHRGRLSLTLGGDHSLAIGSIYGHSTVEPNLGVIWVDAHGDINPPLKSQSGNAHGMPLAFLMHELTDHVPDNLPGFQWVRPCLHLKDIAYIGLRDVDEAEKDIMNEHGVLAFYAEDVKRLGIDAVVRKCIEHVSPDFSRPIHLSFDIDALDPEFAPSTGTPVPGGLTLDEGVYVVETIAKTGKLSVVDLVEVNPELGSSEDQKKTLDAAKKVVSGWGHGLNGRRRA